jgi:hypothetical protein
MTATRTVLSVLLVLACYSCGTDGPTDASAARIRIVSADVNPTNALSFVVSYESTGADSLRLLFKDPAGVVDTTPAQAITSGGNAIVLGVLPATRYELWGQVLSNGIVVSSDTISASSGSLPASLENVKIAISSGHFTTGLNLINMNQADGGYVAVFDSTGRIAWYRKGSDALLVRETKQQRNGDITVYVGTATGANPAVGDFMEVAPDGSEKRRFSAPAPLYTDNHELLMTFSEDGIFQDALFFGYDRRKMTPVRADGADSVLVAHHLLSATADGRTTELFNGWDNFALSDRIEPPDLSIAPDIDHPNSLDIDSDGNYVVSWRNMGAITKIDSRNGRIIWQLGGARNQFTILGDPLGGFSAQHSVRVTPSGGLLMFDNGTRHSPSESRAVEYRLDPVAKTATMIWQFRHAPILYNPFQGSAQRLQNGNTLVSYTSPGIVVEVAPDGTVVAEGTIQATASTTADFYRVTRIRSLYEWRTP